MTVLPAALRCNEETGKWVCSLPGGHIGQHQACYQHDLIFVPAYVWDTPESVESALAALLQLDKDLSDA